MLNEQEQERFLRLWAESRQAVVNCIHATVRDGAAASERSSTLEVCLARLAARCGLALVERVALLIR